MTVPNSVLFDRPLQELVYYGGMDYVLNNGQTVEMSPRETVPEEIVAPEDFVNPGGAAWYLLPENLTNFHELVFCPAVEPTCTSPRPHGMLQMLHMRPVFQRCRRQAIRSVKKILW